MSVGSAPAPPSFSQPSAHPGALAEVNPRWFIASSIGVLVENLSLQALSAKNNHTQNCQPSLHYTPCPPSYFLDCLPAHSCCWLVCVLLDVDEGHTIAGGEGWSLKPPLTLMSPLISPSALSIYLVKKLSHSSSEFSTGLILLIASLRGHSTRLSEYHICSKLECRASG